MAISNSIAPKVQSQVDEPKTISKYLANVKTQAALKNMLSTEKAVQSFVTNVTSLVSVRPELQKCDYSTVVSGALLATTLDLPTSPALGFCSLVPFEDKKNGRFVANFILQYKGYIQLAIRSGFYADIDVREVREGEYLGRDSATGKPLFKFIEDDDEAEKLPVVGYMAYFEYLNGFKKVLYWSREKMINHADRYSPAFSKEATPKARYPKVSYADYVAGKYPREDEWKYSSFWYKDFQAMAFKTMLRQLISKWGVMSIKMQQAFEADAKSEKEEIVVEPTSIERPIDEFFGDTSNAEPENAEVVDFTEEKAIETKPVKKSKKNPEAQQSFFEGADGAGENG